MIFPQPVPRVAHRVSQHDFVLDVSATEPPAGLPLGNGDLSASLYGDPGRLALSVCKGGAAVGEIVLHTPRPDSGPHPPPVPLPLPCTGEGGGAKGLSSGLGEGEGLIRLSVLLRLYDATAQVAFLGGFEIEAFVAATRSLIVLRIRSQGPAPLPATLELCRESQPSPRMARLPSPTSEVRSTKLALSSVEGCEACPEQRRRVRSDEQKIQPSTFDLRPSTLTRVWCDGPFRYLRQDLPPGAARPDGLAVAVCGFVYGARSHSTLREGAALATFDVPASGECLVLAGVATSQDGPDPARRARAEVERALPHGYLLLQREHAVWWERFWTTLETGDSEMTDYRDIYRSKVATRDP